jgi:hypothetical protein
MKYFTRTCLELARVPKLCVFSVFVLEDCLVKGIGAFLTSVDVYAGPRRLVFLGVGFIIIIILVILIISFIF